MTTKFRAHRYILYSKGWLSKGMKYVHIKPDIFVDKTENPMVFWVLALIWQSSFDTGFKTVGLPRNPHPVAEYRSFTDFGKSVFEHDAL
jgi:hypothetical protein